MELHQLRIFLKVAAIQNFTKAAAELGYSQSNISAQIGKLENEVGQPLFNRIGRNVSLTQYGKELIPYAQQMLSMEGEARDMFRADNEIEGLIRVGLVESLFDPLMPAAITSYHRRFPNMKTELTIDTTDVLLEMMRKDQLDFSVLTHDPFNDRSWYCWEIVRLPIVIVANTESELAQRDNVRMEELQGREFILMENDDPYTAYFQHCLSEQSIHIVDFLKMQNPDKACQLIARGGNFYSVMPHHVAQKYLKNGQLAALSMEDFSLTQCAQILLHANKIITPQIRGFLEELHKGLMEIPTRIDTE